MILECDNCGHEWEYQGDQDTHVNCPVCEYKVKVPAEAEVVSSKDDKKKVKKMPARAQVIPPGEESHTFIDEEKQFIQELAECESREEVKELLLKYDQEEFNSLKKKIKGKAKKIRDDLGVYKQIEEVMEENDWNYCEL